VRKAIGLKVGDFVDATATKGGILLRPQVVVDKVDLEKRFEEAERAVKAGRVLGPFKTAPQMSTSRYRSTARPRNTPARA
jgi:hypothetical protein